MVNLVQVVVDGKIIYHSPSDHVDVFKMLIVLAGFDDEDLGVGFLGESTCDNATRGTATMKPFPSESIVSKGAG